MSAPAPNAWEAAYLRFETPEEERRKFLRRLRKLGAESWPKDAQVVELFRQSSMISTRNEPVSLLTMFRQSLQSTTCSLGSRWAHRT